MRELGWAGSNRKEAAAAAARLERRFSGTAEGRPRILTTDESIAAVERAFVRKALAESLDEPDKIELSDLLKRVSHEPAGFAAAFAEPIGSRGVETEEIRPSPSELVDRVLQDHRRTRDELRDCLALVPQMHLEAATREVRLIQAARDARLSWAEIAEAQKLSSRQVAEHRFKRLKDGVSPLLEDQLREHGTDESK